MTTYGLIDRSCMQHVYRVAVVEPDGQKTNWSAVSESKGRGTTSYSFLSILVSTGVMEIGLKSLWVHGTRLVAFLFVVSFLQNHIACTLLAKQQTNSHLRLFFFYLYNCTIANFVAAARISHYFRLPVITHFNDVIEYIIQHNASHKLVGVFSDNGKI